MKGMHETMNAKRRKQITTITEKLYEIQTQLDDLYADIEEVQVDEQDYLDNMPESFQNSVRYETAENAVSNLDDAVQYMSEIIDQMNELSTALELARDGE